MLNILDLALEHLDIQVAHVGNGVSKVVKVCAARWVFFFFLGTFVLRTQNLFCVCKARMLVDAH